jgi:hypothetical protein
MVYVLYMGLGLKNCYNPVCYNRVSLYIYIFTSNETSSNGLSNGVDIVQTDSEENVSEKVEEKSNPKSADHLNVLNKQVKN